MENSRLKSLLESLIFVSEKPLRLPEMIAALENCRDQTEPGDASGEAEQNTVESVAPEAQLEAAASREADKLGRTELQQVLRELAAEYEGNPARGIVLAEVAGGWQFRTRPENAAVLQRLYQPKPTRLSKPSLETLAIVAYRQPIIRAEIDAIRGVDSGGVLKTLLEKGLVRIVGKQDEPGKPMLYGTTQEFLELFQLKSLHELPTLKEFRELEEEFHRKSGSEGAVVDARDAEESKSDEASLLEGDAVQEMVAVLDAEDEAAIETLETTLKELREVEREIFKEEKAEEPSAPPGEKA